MSSNDYNIDAKGDLQAGLGEHEPDDEMKEAMKTRGMATVLKLRAKLEESKAALSEKERELMEVSRAQAIEAKRLEQLAKDLTKQASELGAKKSKNDPAAG